MPECLGTYGWKSVYSFSKKILQHAWTEQKVHPTQLSLAWAWTKPRKTIVDIQLYSAVVQSYFEYEG